MDTDRLLIHWCAFLEKNNNTYQSDRKNSRALFFAVFLFYYSANCPRSPPSFCAIFMKFARKENFYEKVL